jgi:type IV pilus biogenesis protein PilP
MPIAAPPPLQPFAATPPQPSFAPTPVSMPMPMQSPKVIKDEKPKSTITDIEVSRITGADGKYSAVLKMANGDMKPVRAGDKITDHATVRWISSSSVLVEEYGETHTIRIKNVDAIFSAMR